MKGKNKSPTPNAKRKQNQQYQQKQENELNQQSQFEYVLEGASAVWPKGSTPEELTCLTFVPGRDNSSSLTTSSLNRGSVMARTSTESKGSVKRSASSSSRVYTGSVSGAVYIWQQHEELKCQLESDIVVGNGSTVGHISVNMSVNMSNKSDRQMCLLSGGKLSSVVMDVHDGKVTDLKYTTHTTHTTNDNHDRHSDGLNGDGSVSENDVDSSRGDIQIQGKIKNKNKNKIKNENESQDAEEDENMDEDADENEVETEVENEVEVENMFSCGSDGFINRWLVDREDSLPLEHLSACLIDVEGDTGDDECDSKCDGKGDSKGVSKCNNKYDNSVIAIRSDGCEITIATNHSLHSISCKSTTDMVPSPTHYFTKSKGTIHKIAVDWSTHNSEQGSFFATVSTDDSICIWDARTYKQIACTSHPSPTSLSFTPDSTALAVGNYYGELLIISFKVLNAEITDHAISEIIFKKSISGKLKKKSAVTQERGSERGSRREIVKLKYSPDGSILAVGCKDSFIHLLSVNNGYKRIGVCKGHTSCISQFDFSSDGKILQSTDITSKHLLYWETSTGKSISGSISVRDIKWNSWTVPLGWSVLGVRNGTDGEELDEETPCVCRSSDGLMLAAGGSVLKTFRYPCLAHSTPSVYKYHTNTITDISFINNSEGLLTVSGDDSIIFQWNLK